MTDTQFIAIAVLAGFVCLLSAAYSYTTHRTQADSVRRLIESASGSASPGAHSDVIKQIVTGYHEQAMSQARVQFYFSLTAAVIGFAWILYAGSGVTADNPHGLWRVLPGAVMDVLALLFFRQAEQTRQRATDLYDRLRRDEQLAESQRLAEKIEHEVIRSAVLAHIALQMADANPPQLDFGPLLKSIGVATARSSTAKKTPEPPPVSSQVTDAAGG